MKEDKVVFRGENKHYNYWLNHSLPVIIVLYSPSSDKCIWEVFNEQKVEKTEKGWKINIPYNQKLEDSKEQLQELADNQSEYERRWNSLVVAKGWMLETIRQGESILEVQEWINKSSGRGKFILKVEEDGEEKTLFESWKMAVNKYLKKEIKFDKQETDVILTFGTNLGVTDRETQLSNIDECINDIQEVILQLKEEKNNKCKLYKCLGTFSGILIAILLI